MMPRIPALEPFDEHNQALQANVHPVDWQNPIPQTPYHLIVIGAGTAGLVTAAGAAGLGARVALIERELMGGDCLNVGCIPSKALIHSARKVSALRAGFSSEADFLAYAQDNFADSMERMRRLRAHISPHDSAQRFRDLGVDVYLGDASFIDNGTISVCGSDGERTKLKYKKAVIATGARAAAPEIPGLDQVEYLTNETLFSLTKLPARLGIIGSGPIGCEMAQTFARFGSEVTLYERQGRILTREDPDASQVIQQHLQQDGVQFLLNSQEMKIETGSDGTQRVGVMIGQGKVHTEFDQLLIAIGRRPNIDGLNLETVGVDCSSAGIVVDDHLQTTNPNVYACGDVASTLKFTHLADFQARAVIQNSLFSIGPFGRKRAGQLIVPWATYTSPELAHVGLSESQASEQGIAYDTYVQQFHEVDRAILQDQTDGFVKVLTRKGSDRILGATIVAENAGDLISEITLAMNNNIGLSKIAAVIHPYPTQADAIRKLGDQFNRTKLTRFSQRVLNLLRWVNVGH